MLAFQLTPALLATLVLAAHFLRRGRFVPFVVCIAAAAFVFVRRPWARRALQAFLVLGIAEWAWTSAQLVNERRAEGEPAGRLVVIMGVVMAVTAGAALLLQARRAAAHFGGKPTT